MIQNLVLLNLILIATVTMAGTFTANKYEITLTPDFNDHNFTGNVKIHVATTGSVKEFDVKVSKDLEIERVVFAQAAHFSRGHPQTIEHSPTTTYDEKSQLLHVTLLGAVTEESIKEAGFVEIEYKGKIGALGANKGLFFRDAINFDSNLKGDNVIHLFPVLDDVPALVVLSVVTPYRAGVETSLKAGDHRSVPGGELFSNNFNSGDEKVKLSDVQLKINAPTFLVLEQN